VTTHRPGSAPLLPAGRDVRLPGRLLVGLGLSVLVLGLSVAVLVQPWFTGVVSPRTSEYSTAGVTPERGLELAQGVREYVAGTSADVDQDLPSSIDGRPGFDEAARSHLADVANVISRARLLTGLVGGALTVWLLVEVVRRRTRGVADGLRMGAYLSAGFVVVAVVAGLTSFDWLFTAFHGVFFDPGTWTFPADSLLIQLFPEPFWIAAAVSWAALVLLGALLLWLSALWLDRAARAEHSAAHAS
jgi:integral membrane protein (TIGR01906 family)